MDALGVYGVKFKYKHSDSDRGTVTCYKCDEEGHIAPESQHFRRKRTKGVSLVSQRLRL